MEITNSIQRLAYMRSVALIELELVDGKLCMMIYQLTCESLLSFGVGELWFSMHLIEEC